MNNHKLVDKLITLVRLIFVLMVGGINLHAQELHHNINKIEDQYNKLNGRYMAKQAIVEDSLGYLWIATPNGLCKYSGSRIDCMKHDPGDPSSIDDDDVIYLNLDSDHLIWASFNNRGVNAFDINGKKIYALSYRPNQKQSLLHNRVWATWEDQDGFIWISYFYGGISRFDKQDGSLVHYSIDDEEFLKKHRPKTVVGVIPHEHEPHTYWLATTVGLVKFNTRTQDQRTFIFQEEIDPKTSESQFNKSVLKPLWTRSMCRDAKGDLWIGTFGGLIHFNTSSETYKILRNHKSGLLNSVPGVMTYDDSHIMLSYREGLALLNIESNELTNLREVEGNGPNNYLYARIYKAKNGCTYFLNKQRDKTGIYKYCNLSDITRDTRTGHYIANILATDNYVHYHRLPGQVESRHLITGERINHSMEISNGTTIQTLFPLSGDSLLVSDYYHMYTYHPLHGLTKMKELSQKDVYRHESVFVDSDGEIWNGRQRNGLFRLDKNGEVRHYNHETSPSLVYQDYIVDFLEDEEGDIWIATEQGWSIFNKKNNTTRNYLSKDESARLDINIRTINALEQTENGQIWIAGASSGVSLWDKRNETFVYHVNTSSGLRSNAIYDMIADSENNLWVATAVGLSWIDTESYEVKNFGKEYGINSTIYSLSMSDDKIFAGYGEGYYAMDHRVLLNHKRPLPTPVVTGLELYDQKQDTLLHSIDGIYLHHDQNFFTFEFGSVNYFDPELEEYQYQLKGIDQSWVNDRGERKAGYTNINHGEYDFQVRVRTESQEWSAPTKVRLVIHPAWFQTWWFFSLLAAIAGLLVWRVIKYYLQKKKRELEIDKRFAQLETMILKSQMNPHFIFNSLNSIRYLFMKDEKEKGLKYITKFAKLLRSTLHHGDQALVHLEDEVELTELFIQLEQLRFEDTFTFSSFYEDSSTWKEVMIPPFVIQPIVENAFWHGLLPLQSDDKRLDLKIEREAKGYRIIIEDNGVGLSSKSENTANPEINKTKSYGLNIIKERFDLMNINEQLNYHIQLNDSKKYQSGTMVVITISEKIS